jgi:hypothetical protein
VSCLNPIDAAVLTDYWLAALPNSEEEAVEEHLFSCDDCGTRLREIVAMAEEIRKLSGSLVMIVSDAFVKHASEQGFRVREYSPPRFGSVECTVAVDDDFVVGHLSADLSTAKRVDLAICDPQRVERFRLEDIPFHSQAPRVTFQQSITYGKAAPSETIIARLVGFDEAGAESLLGEYTFNHTRTIAGPAGW